MPFYSKAQQGYMFSQHPSVAKKMADNMKGKVVNGRKRSATHPLKGLPYRSSGKRAVPGARRRRK